MNNYLNYCIGVIKSPTKTFTQVIKDKKINQIFIYNLVALGVLGFLSSIFPVRATDSAIPFIKIFETYAVIVWPVAHLLGSFIQNVVVKIFSKSGSFVKIFVVESLIGITFGVIDLILRFTAFYIPLIEIASFVFSLAAIYINIIGISIVYKISKSLAFFTIVLISVAYILLIIAGVIGYFVITK